MPESNTFIYSKETTTPTTQSSTSFDLSGYNIPGITVTSTSENKSDNKLHADINGLLSLFDKHGIKVKVTSGYREGATTSSGHPSYHASGKAIDIVPEDGDFSKLAQAIKNTPEIVTYMRRKGLGILDETTKEMLAKTSGTGAHYHIGPDKLAQNFWTT